MQIAGHYASFIPVFRPWRGPDGNSSSSSRRDELSPSRKGGLEELVDETGKRKRQLEKRENKESEGGGKSKRSFAYLLHYWGGE